MTNVLIVEDHESMCDSLRAVLSQDEEFRVIAEVPSADFAELYCEKMGPDLIFMDVCTSSKPVITIILMSGQRA